MSLTFDNICQLFEELVSLSGHQHLLCDRAVWAWFSKHELNLPDRGPAGLALMSCLLPEKRADRVYGFQEKRLEPVIVKALGLGHGRMDELHRLQDQQGLDFASAVQRVMSSTDETSQAVGELSVDEIERTLDRVASTCAFSSWEIKQDTNGAHVDPVEKLVSLFRRLRSLKAKWMIRLLLKYLRPAEVPEMVALNCFHFLLPDLLRVITEERSHPSNARISRPAKFLRSKIMSARSSALVVTMA